MSRQWHHGHQTACGDELRVCFGFPYSNCVKDCSGNVLRAEISGCGQGILDMFFLIYGICFILGEHNTF